MHHQVQHHEHQKTNGEQWQTQRGHNDEVEIIDVDNIVDEENSDEVEIIGVVKKVEVKHIDGGGKRVPVRRSPRKRRQRVVEI